MKCYEMAYAITNLKFDLKAPQQVVMLKMFIPGQKMIYKIHQKHKKIKNTVCLFFVFVLKI